MSAVFGLAETKPHAGSQPGSPYEANRGKGPSLLFMPAWRSSAQSDILARYQDFSDPD